MDCLVREKEKKNTLWSLDLHRGWLFWASGHHHSIMLAKIHFISSFIYCKFLPLSHNTNCFFREKKKKDSDFTLSLQSLFFIDPIFEIRFPVYYTHFMHVQFLSKKNSPYDKYRYQRILLLNQFHAVNGIVK